MLLFLLIANGLRKRLPVIGIFLATAAAATYASILLLRAWQGHQRKTIIVMASQMKHESEQKG